MKRRVCALVGVFLVMAGGAAAQSSMQDGVAAFDRKDYAAALAIWYALSECGDPEAQAGLARMYRDGLGVSRDYKEAAKWYSLAAGEGVARAQTDLGRLFAAGLGVQQDQADAARWFKRAADQDFAEAQSELGSLYAQGSGVEKNPVEAMKWFLLAASRFDGGARNRDLLAPTMQPAEIAEAEKRAKEWTPR